VRSNPLTLRIRPSEELLVTWARCRQCCMHSMPYPGGAAWVCFTLHTWECACCSLQELMCGVLIRCTGAVCGLARRQEAPGCCCLGHEAG
jgi:hypothetical protein